MTKVLLGEEAVVDGEAPEFAGWEAMRGSRDRGGGERGGQWVIVGGDGSTVVVKSDEEAKAVAATEGAPHAWGRSGRSNTGKRLG